MSAPAGGDPGHGMGNVWQWVVIAALVLFSNMIGVATNQIGDALSMAKFNFQIICAIGAFVLIAKAIKG